jgi:hypothetical protein
VEGRGGRGGRGGEGRGSGTVGAEAQYNLTSGSQVLEVLGLVSLLELF